MSSSYPNDQSGPAEKRCTGCGETKPLDAFGNHPQGKCGKQARCHACERTRCAAYRRAYPVVIRSYYQANREAKLAYQQAYAAAHPDQERDRKRQWVRQLRAARPAYIRAQRHAYRARQRGAPGLFTVADVVSLHEVQRGRCAYCGDPLGQTYHVDHMTALVCGGSNWPANLALACARCNLRKGALSAGAYLARLILERRAAGLPSCAPSPVAPRP